MKADVVAFAYRGFSHSEGHLPSEDGIMLDIDAITEFYKTYVSRLGEAETILWGKSFGCATSIVATLSEPELFETIVLESPFTSVAAVYRSFVPYCALGSLLACMSNIGWRNDHRIGDIRAPIFFISGLADPLTPNFMTHEL